MVEELAKDLPPVEELVLNNRLRVSLVK